MATVASLEVAITANTAGAERGFAQVNSLLGQLVANSGGATRSFATMTGAVATGSVAANVFMGALSKVTGSIMDMGKGALDLSSRLEQAKIGFTTMLGGAQQADSFIRKLQAFAESTPFSFPGIQQVAQSFMAMGVEAKNVIPIVTDVSNALAAAGHGGDTDALVRVGASLSEIAAQGKVTAEQLRELSRNGIAVMPMLADSMHTTTAEVRKLAEAGQISATQFFEAFHSQVAQRYGDIQAEQAKTWAVAASNVMDILGRLTTETLADFFQVLTNGALALQRFLNTDAVKQWAADMKTSIQDVAITLGLLDKDVRIGPMLGPSPAEIKKALAPPTLPTGGTDAATSSAKDYTAEIKAAQAEIHGITAALTGVKDQQDAVGASIDAVNKHYELQQRGLKDQQEANASAIDATKAKYEAILAPLERAREQLGRLAEDTKADFANIMDPLKAGLEQTNRQIEDAKDGYEAITKPIERQIAAINKANSALQKQRQLEAQIADIALRKQIMAAGGDPAARGEIARRMKLNEFAQEELGFQVDLLEMNNKKGRNDKQLEALQKQANGLRAEEIGLQRQGLGLIDKSATAEIEKQKIINDAAKERGAIAQAEADIAADAAKAPLETQLETLKTQLASVLDPLEAQQKSFARAIQEATAAEAAALKPIADAQTEVARTIADVTQSQKDALAPLEEQQKAIAAQIKESEAAQRAALEPLKEQQAALEAQSKEMENHKRQITDQIAAWKDTTAAIKEAAAEAAKVAAPLDLSGGTKEPDLPPALTGHSLIPADVIQSIRDFAAAAKDLGAELKRINDSGDLTKISNGILLLGTVWAGAKIVEGFSGFTLGMIAIIPWLGQVTTGFGMLGTAAGTLGAALGVGGLLMGSILGLIAIGAALAVAWNTDFMGIRTTVETTLAALEARLGPFGAAFFDVFGIALLLWSGQWGLATEAIKGHWDTWSKNITALLGTWKTDWDKAWVGIWADWDRDWAKLKDAPGKAWGDLSTASDGFWTKALADWDRDLAKAAVLWDPIAKAIDAVTTAIRGLPVQLPDWMRYIMPGLPTGGRTGGASFNLPSGNGGGSLDLTAGNPGQFQIGLNGDEAAAACGPYAALLFANAVGRFPSAQEAVALARKVGWTPGLGMAGPASELALLGEMGIGAVQQEANLTNIRAALKAGSPVAISTPKHYFGATGIGADDRLDVGGTGTVFKGGSANMTLEEISAIGGGLQGIIVLSGQFGEKIDAAAQRAAAGLTNVMTPIRAAGVGMAQSLAQGIGQGDTVVSGAVEAIVTEAIKQGMDPLIALALAKAESSFNPKAPGGGLFQMTETGQGAGMSKAQIEDPAINAGKFLSSHKALYDQLVAEGHAGEDLAATFGRLAEVSNPALAYRYADAYRALVAQFGTARSAALVTGQAQNTLGRDLQYNAQWVQTMATQQANLATVLQGQVDPATIQTSQAMTNLSAVLGPIERQVAGGAISMDTLQFKLVDLARATGLATAPWRDFDAGLIDINEAMMRVVMQSADAGPAFEALRQQLGTTNAITDQGALAWLQLALNYGKATPAIAANAAATTTATAATTGLNSATGTVNQTIDPTLYTQTASAVTDLTKALDGGSSAFGKIGEAASQASEIIREFLGASQSLGDYLDGHTFDFHVNLPDLPDWAIPGSPMPLETGFRGVADALDSLNRVSAASLRDLEMPSSAAMTASVVERGSSGGGGTTVIDNRTINIPGFLGTKDELVDALHDGLLRKKRRNGRLRLGDQD